MLLSRVENITPGSFRSLYLGMINIETSDKDKNLLLFCFRLEREREKLKWVRQLISSIIAYRENVK